jgi:hypothetical protein
MREIEFRGKLERSINSQTPAGTWIYGMYSFLRDRACIYEKDSAIGLFVDPETVGQYTGLKDKNGVKIFEGDIVHVTAGEVNELMQVMFVNGAFCYLGTRHIDFPHLNSQKLRVIGNIHDNPELLNGEGGAK